MRQQSVIPGARPSRHVPPNLPAVTHYRAKAIECAHRLHILTWDVAVRRANCFSQALGVAVTSYMASLSDGGPGWNNGGVWARHGYLITFEGLLSAVGKELGMIEGEIPTFLITLVSGTHSDCSSTLFFRCIRRHFDAQNGQRYLGSG
jgi:hypothetical protein